MKTDSSIAVLRTTNRRGSTTGKFMIRDSGFVEKTYGDADGEVILQGDKYVIRLKKSCCDNATIIKVKRCFGLLNQRTAVEEIDDEAD